MIHDSAWVREPAGVATIRSGSGKNRCCPVVALVSTTAPATFFPRTRAIPGIWHNFQAGSRRGSGGSQKLKLTTPWSPSVDSGRFSVIAPLQGMWRVRPQVLRGQRRATTCRLAPTEIGLGSDWAARTEKSVGLQPLSLGSPAEHTKRWMRSHEFNFTSSLAGSCSARAHGTKRSSAAWKTRVVRSSCR